MSLYQHDQEFSIRINGQELMHSRQHESEIELARLGCAHLAQRKSPHILIGGLGMGYTLRAALDMVGRHATVVVNELLVEVVKWNREILGDLNGHPLDDERVDLKQGDVIQLISRSESAFDAILLDVDNGPRAMVDSGNSRLYSREGILACRRALRDGGCLAVWSAEASKEFERLMMNCGLHVRRFRVPAYKGSKSQSRFVWVASEDQTILPAGGGEPRPSPKARKSTGRGIRRSSKSKNGKSSYQ